MPKKLDKYGIKFWVLAGPQTKYVVNIISYLGAQEKGKRGDLFLAESVIMYLVQRQKQRLQRNL